jgi:hypothetical protein
MENPDVTAVTIFVEFSLSDLESGAEQEFLK